DDGPFSNIFRLLLLTGQRRQEIGALQWNEIDFARKMIVLSPARTKNSRLHELPLSAQALAILSQVPRRNSSEYLFGVRGYKDWAVGKAKLDQRAGILITIFMIYGAVVQRCLANSGCSSTTLKRSSTTTLAIVRALPASTSVPSTKQRCAQRCRSGPTTLR